jgi:predicted alpha/beta superfamily hydrolase
LETTNYIPSRADPCLFIKRENEKRSYLIIYVDDGGIFCETRKEIKELIDKLSKHFVVKDLGNMETFCGCKIINNKKMTPFTFTSQNC